MPKRSNAFQRAVRFIYQQLMGNEEVPESMFLIDRLTGKEREVDVVIEKDVADHHLVLCLECVGRTRPASVEWVEQMACKHESLPTDRLVLISEKGFTTEAKEKAAKLGIETLTPEEVLDVDWTKVVGKEPNVSLAYYPYKPLRWLIVFAEEYDDLESLPMDTRSVIYGNDGHPIGTIDSVIRSVADSKMNDIMDDLDQMPEDGVRLLKLELAIREGSYILDTSGGKRRVVALRYEVELERITSRVPLKHLSLKGISVAYGELGPPFATEGTLVITEREGSSMKTELKGKFGTGMSFIGRAMPPRVS